MKHSKIAIDEYAKILVKEKAFWKHHYACPKVKKLIPHIVGLLCANWDLVK